MPPARTHSTFAIDVPASLLAQACAGRTEAFEQLYRWFERPVFTLALRLCGDRDEAQEVLQDTMLKLFRQIHTYRGEGGSPFWGWLRQIAVNEALMRLRRGRQQVMESTEGGDDREHAGEDFAPPPAAADAALLQRALLELPALTRSVLWLYHAEGYTHDEIAVLMQRTPSFSKSQLARGTRRLRTMLRSRNRPMPDDTRMLHPQPRDWSEALAALPLESPPRDAWKTIAANLHPAPAAARPDRRPLWLAIAAGVAMALVLPLFRHVTPEVLPTPVADTRDTPADATSTAETPSPDTAIAVAGTSPDPDPLASPQPATVEPAKTVDAKPAIPATRMAQQRIRPADKPVVSGTPSGPTDETALATLHAQSAQLEALLAMARDEHVASGMVAALGDELGAQVANIDAALIQPDLDARQRTELWRQRVDTLQRLVGLEATQRLYAARGQSYDVALVSVD